MEIILNFCDWLYDILYLYLFMFIFVLFKNDLINKNLVFLKKLKYK